MNINKSLYRIIRGRFRLSVGDLVLLFTEPDSTLIAESYEVYEKAYDEAYGQSSYIDKELDMVLVEQGIWNPIFEKELEQQNQELDNLKVEAFENFFQPKELLYIKRRIWLANRKIETLLSRKHKLDHLTCTGVAENARWNWLLAQCIRPQECDGRRLIESYQDNIIPHVEIKKIARSDIWRGIWNASKRTRSLFDKSAVDLTRDQVTLTSYSSMFDNVYEHPDSPNEKVIEDDDCLDGWFIVQRRKNEKQKKQSEVNDVIRNPKISNAKEVYVLSKAPEDAEGVYALNDGYSRQIISNRSQEIKSNGSLKEQELSDVRQDIEMEKTAIINKQLKR